jgi:hypothetical protein
MTDAIVPKPETDPWQEFAARHGGLRFTNFLKFNRGAWELGEDKVEVPATTAFVVNMNELHEGWTKWSDGKPIDQKIGRAIDGYIVPPRSSLGDDDPSLWEDDGKGGRRDPWQKTLYLPVRDLSDGEIACFTSSSEGGFQAVARLCGRFARERHRHPGKMPVFLLEGDSYHHRKLHIEVETPEFRFIGWEPWDADGTNGAAISETAPPLLEQQGRGDMDDEIPF